MKKSRCIVRPKASTLLLVACLFLFLCPAGAVTAATGSYELRDASIFQSFFRKYYPDTAYRDAPAILNEIGYTCRYSVIAFPTEYGERWRFSGKGYERFTPTDKLKTPPTMRDARELLALSGLDMKEIMGYRALLEAGDRDGLIALLTRYIDPKMEKHNRMVVEGYDFKLAINKTGDHVFDIAIEPGKLNDIKGAVKLFHKGQYEKYRSKLQEYLQDYPSLSYLHIGIGNSYFAEGDLAGAQQWYRLGASANPMNPMLGYSMAFCHLAAGDETRAIEALIGSVTVCRNNLLAWLALDCLLSGQGGRVVDQRFKNRTYAGRGGLVIVDKGVPPRLVESWVYFGASEVAINSKRSELLDTFDDWGIQECELYKLAHLLGMYVIQKGEPGGIRDSYLENLLTIHKEGYLKQYVLFDMIAPYTRYHLTSTISPEEKRMLREYIDRFVARR